MVHAGSGKVVEGARGDGDGIRGDAFGPFLCACGGIFQAAFPFQDGPAFEVVLRQFAEDALEVDLAISNGPNAPRLRHRAAIIDHIRTAAEQVIT